jgi:hypothetical protein
LPLPLLPVAGFFGDVGGDVYGSLAVVNGSVELLLPPAAAAAAAVLLLLLLSTGAVLPELAVELSTSISVAVSVAIAAAAAVLSAVLQLLCYYCSCWWLRATKTSSCLDCVTAAAAAAAAVLFMRSANLYSCRMVATGMIHTRRVSAQL